MYTICLVYILFEFLKIINIVNISHKIIAGLKNADTKWFDLILKK